MLNKIQAVIFDHDGTLVESEGRHFELWKKILKPFDIDFQAEEYIREHAGIPTLQNAQVLIDKYKLNLSAEELCQLKEKEVRSSLHGIAFELLPGVIESMQAFREAGLRMGIATGAGQTEVRSSTKAHSFDRFIDFAASSDEVKKGKPAPDVYLLAAKKLGIAPKNCMAIEDSNTGLKSALAAGMPCLIVRNAWSAAHAYEGATAIFDSMLEARDFILNS